MKTCIIISNYVVNKLRENILIDKIKFFKNVGIDVLLVSSHHIKKYECVDHYMSINTLNVQKKYISDNLHLYFETFNKKFYYKFPSLQSTQFNQSSHFFKMYQLSIQFCEILEYDFVFFMEFDMLFDHNVFVNQIINVIDRKKVYFYKVNDNEHDTSYHSLFFYGNTKELRTIFSESNLDILANYAKTNNVWSIEHAFWIIINDKRYSLNRDCLIFNKKLSDHFYVENLFSSNNICEIFRDVSTKKYYFLIAKGDFNGNKNKIGGELFIENNLIYSGVHIFDGSHYLLELQDNVYYKINRYDGDIKEENFYNSSYVYTDSNKSSVNLYCI